MATTTTGEKPSLCIVRHYNAPPEEVWQAWTDPEALKQWFRPDDTFAIPFVAVDVREGGRYEIRMQSADGEEHNVSGVYKEVVPNHKLVFTWSWKTTPERESLVTVQLEPEANGTELTLRHEQFFDTDARDEHKEGWTGALTQLEGYL